MALLDSHRTEMVTRERALGGRDEAMPVLRPHLCPAVGYNGRFTPKLTYEEARGGRTGHAEAVLAVREDIGARWDKLRETE
jgi:hypothetical protein